MNINLSNFNKNIYSQFREDGIIEEFCLNFRIIVTQNVANLVPGMELIFQTLII